MSESILNRVVLILVLCCMVGTATTAAAAQREVVPTPPGGGAPIPLAAPGDPDLRSPGRSLPDDRFLVARGSGFEALRGSPVGGDDVLIPSADDDRTGVSLDIATDGTLFAADAVAGGSLNVRRSTDGGTTWTVWATLDPPGAGEILTEPCLRVAEGVEDRVLLAYVRHSATGRDVLFTWAPLSGTTGVFAAADVVMSSSGVTFHHPRFDTDAKSWSDWYVYLAASGDSSTGSDIWFVRSIDQGASFEAAYEIGDPGGVNDYVNPDVCYGNGGFVHVTWALLSPTDAFDAAIRYRRAGGYAGGGTAAWGTVTALTTHTDGYFDLYPRIAASSLDARIAVVHERLERIPEGYFFRRPQVEYSATGADFADVAEIPAGPFSICGLEHDPVRDRWVLCGEDYYVPTLQDTDDPLDFGAAVEIGDRSFYTGSGLIDGHALAIDPSRGGRAGVLWTQFWTSRPDTLRFDAEWRSDPGYPVMADGFPVDLPVAPVSGPALYDLDRDGDLEIFWTGGGFVFAMHHDGMWVAGWPVNLGVALAGGPVAITALFPGSDPLVAVGTQDGRAYVLDAHGGVMDGWPVTMSDYGSVHVSWATLMMPYTFNLAAAGPGALKVFDWDGNERLSWSSLEYSPVGPPACGDIDGDGFNELVCSFGSILREFDFQSFSSSVLMTASTNASAAVSLADVDLDGDVEIAFPLADGTLHLLQGDGSELPGWPYLSDTDSPLSRPAIANVLGTFEPEIAVAARSFNVHLLYADGTEQFGYPVQNDGWYIYASPILAHLEDPHSADIVVGARGSKVWAWSNGGSVVPGYPRAVPENVYEACAFGDLDGDGFTELVVPTNDRMLVFETRQTVNAVAAYSWPMEGYDSARSGCLDCPDLSPTAVDEDEATATHVSFAAPRPNPVSAGTVFSFAVPREAVAEIEVLDLRGRRVRTVTRQEVDPGRHLIAWDGRDGEGRPLGAGNYVARLRVRGAGIDETMTRKVTVIR